MHEDTGPAREFEDGLRRWASRPVRTTPVDGARRVRARLEPRAPSPFGARLAFRVALSVSMALTVGLGFWAVWQPRQPASRAGAHQVPPPLPSNVMVFWIDQDTPVYFVTGPGETESTP